MNRAFTLTVRTVRRVFRSVTPEQGPVFSRVGLQFDRALNLVRAFYLVSAVISYQVMTQLHFLSERSDAWFFLWPVAWLSMFDANAAVFWVALGCLLAGLAAFQFPENRAARGAFAVLCLFVVAIHNSQGAIGHYYHVWAWIAFCLVFLPAVRSSVRPPRAVQMTYLTVIVATQALTLFFYSLAGFWKFQSGLLHLVHGVEGNFSPRGFALQLANRTFDTNTFPPLVDLAIDYYLLSWPMLLALIYVQMVAIMVVLRPRLHLLWGWLLIGFHIGTWLLMEIPYPLHMLWAMLLLVMSPFRPQHWRLRDVVSDLPIFGQLVRWLAAAVVRRRVVRPVPAE